MIDHGRAIAEGTSDELKGLVGAERIELTVTDAATLAPAQRALARFAVGEQQADPRNRSLVTPIEGGAPVLAQALRELERAQIAVQDVGLRRPTLDDVFLSLTGHGAEPEEATE